MHAMGQIFREVIAGLRDILMGGPRSRVSSGLERTMIQQRENNR
jgi:hypothetical protein